MALLNMAFLKAVCWALIFIIMSGKSLAIQFVLLDVLHGIADEFRKASLAVNHKPKFIESKLNK
jgi:hypothetical protein